MANARSFLFSFRSSHKEAYVIEFSHLKLRIYMGHSLLGVDGKAVIKQSYDDGIIFISSDETEPQMTRDFEPEVLEIETPYTYNDLWDNEEMCCKLQTIQNSDILYIFSENHPIKILKKYALDNWVLEDLKLKGGPFLAMNTEAIVVRSSGVEGEVTLNSSENLFSSTDVGRLMRLRVLDDDTTPWSAGVSVHQGDICFSDNKYYEAQNTANTGAIKPVHGEGTKSDGKVRWTYLNDGKGVVKILEYVNEKCVIAKVISRLPEKVVDGTSCFEMGVICQGQKYPKAGAFFKNRFAFLINTNKGPWVCLSCNGDYNNFSDTEYGETTAETAITVPVLNTEFNEGKWLYANNVLFVGTGAAEFYIDAMSNATPMAADNVKILQISQVGSKAIMPIGIGSLVFFVDRYGYSLRELMFNYYNDGYDQIDVSLLGKHLFNSRIVQMCYQETPDKLLWCVLGNGELAVLTFSREQEVCALSRHDMSGEVESIAVIPNLNDCTDEVWFEIKRKIGHEEKRTVEWLDNGMPLKYPLNYKGLSPIEREKKENEYVLKEAFYLDGAVSFRRGVNDDSEEILGLSHLEGKIVSLFADGYVCPSQMVINGKVTIDKKMKHVVVGLDVCSQFIPQRFYLNSEISSGIGQRQRVNHVKLMLYRSGGGKIGEDENHLHKIYYRRTDEAMNVPTALFDGIKDILFDGKTSSQGEGSEILIENSSPLPMNILAIVPAVDVEENC